VFSSCTLLKRRNLFNESEKMVNNKILIVEDDKIISELIEWRLKKMGYTVSGKVATGLDAVNLTNETMPDAILMDIFLQGNMDGIEAAKIIKEKFTIPIIFLTAYSDEKVLERIIPIKPSHYILKPFTDDDLRIALRLSLG
jgi:two-component system, response regulator PdtaR